MPPARVGHGRRIRQVLRRQPPLRPLSRQLKPPELAPQVVPTVFIAFSNSMRHPAHDAVGGMSLANFLTSQRASGFPGATSECCVCAGLQ